MEPRFPEFLTSLLDGNDLEAKIGTTLLFVAAGAEGWPRVATLSVGELLAVSPTELLVTLYRGSRTTRAVQESGHALLIATHDGGLAKVQLRLETLSEQLPGRVILRATVVSCEQDEVPYARITHGIEFELVDGTRAVERWELQIEELREVAEQ